MAPVRTEAVNAAFRQGRISNTFQRASHLPPRGMALRE